MYIFWAVSAPLRFLSYCASIACCSCLTSFAYSTVQMSESKVIPRALGGRTYFLDGKLLIRLNFDLPGLFHRLLLDERHLV